MIKIEPLKSFLGFGEGLKRGEYYFSQGMGRSREGIKPNWKITADIDSDSLANLKTFRVMDEKSSSGVKYIFGASASDGKIFEVRQGLTNWVEGHASTQGTYGNGLITDQKDRLLYLQNQYLGKMEDGVWDDTWKDFGKDVGNIERPADLFEDWVVMGNGTTVALLNITDDSFNADALSFPEGFSVKDIKSGKNGTLIGVNFGTRSALILWDCRTQRSIAPWIWNDGSLLSITKYEGIWIVSAGNELFITNGYTKKHLTIPPDIDIHDIAFGPTYPSGMITKNFYLFINGGLNLPSRKKRGLWIYDLRTELWEFCPVGNFVTSDVSLGALFIDSGSNFYTSYKTDIPNLYYVGKIQNAAPAKSFYISSVVGRGENKKTAEGLFLNMAFDMKYFYSYVPNWEVTAGIYNFKRQFWTYGQTSATIASKTELIVDGTVSGMNEAEIGDMIIFLAGASAGDIAFITNISGEDTNDEHWFLDRKLTGAYAEKDILMNILPIKRIGTTWVISTKDIGEHYFPIKKSSVSKKFLLFLYLKSSAAQSTPEISGLSFLYNDLGHL